MGDHELESPDEATVVLVPGRRPAGQQGETLVPVPERLLLERESAAQTRPAGDLDAADNRTVAVDEASIATVIGPAPAGAPVLRDPSEEETFVTSEDGSPGARAVPGTGVETCVELFETGARGGEGALCAASQLEAAFYQRSVRAGRGTRRYSLDSVRGAGGMGTVLQVLDLDLGRRTAMKTLLPVWRDRDDLLASFATEARITGFLEHPNVIPVHDLGLAWDAGLYYTMKLVEGESLHAVLRRLQANDAETVSRFTTFALLGIFRKICDAVAFAHSNRLLHLDIKPQNVLLGRFGEVFLIDWGLARVCGDPADEADPVKRAFLSELLESIRSRRGQIAGTPAFMAPEQANGDLAALDERTDVFLLGATLYHMFALSPPYSAPGLAQALALARRCEPEPPQARNPGRQIPAEVGRIVMKAMAREKEQRHASVGELAAEVDSVMAGRWRPETRKSFAAGELLMKQGDAAEESYVIVSGHVEVFTEANGRRVFLRECRAGEIVGEMALVSNEPRSATVKAVEDTVVAVVTKEKLSEQLDGLPPYVAGMVSMLVSRLRDLSASARSRRSGRGRS